MTAKERRYERTLQFLEASIPPPATVLDLGVDNPLSQRMRLCGYEVTNTPDLDLDFHPDVVMSYDVQLVTAFEILEHLFNPFEVLRAIQAPRLIATVPLRLWFANAYRNPNDRFDQHFHEFERWQFDQLLAKTGWEVSRSETWTSPSKKIGLRPLLRSFTPRYYAVDAFSRQSDRR